MPGWLWLSAKPKQRPNNQIFEVEYIKPIFDSFNFIYEGNSVERSIPDAARSWPVSRSLRPTTLTFCLLHADDEPEEIKAKLRAYYAACDDAHRAHGYKDLPKATLLAKSRASSPASRVGTNGLCRSTFGLIEHPHMPDDRKHYLELLIGTCIKALDEMQQECGLETQHQEVEPSPLNPSRIRCANCCLELERKAA